MTQKAGLAALGVVNLRQQALMALRRAITTGELTPGTHLVEEKLSEQLQISRATLREAMRQLQHEGLVAADARGRLSVRSLDAQDILDIFTVRAALEALAARILSQTKDRDTAVGALHQAVRAMDEAINQTMEERMEADLNFHHTMCQLTGNPMLLHSWKALEGPIRMSLIWAGAERTAGNMSVDWHTAIVDVIAAGDAAAAAEHLFAHINEAATNLVI
jgi:DNA-binding GntR family transcriptional regulator